jgi:hypothetical protein
MLRYKLESSNECAQIEPVDVREDIMEEIWSEAEHVHHIFSSFEVGMVFFSDITGSGIKGMRGELHSPKYITPGSKDPRWQMKVAFHSSPSLIRILLYPHWRSILVNHFDPFSLSINELRD